MNPVISAFNLRMRARRLRAGSTPTSLTTYLDLSVAHFPSRATAAFVEGDAEGFCASAGRMSDQLALVFDNCVALLAREIYEPALVYAYTNVKQNFHGWDRQCIDLLWCLSQPERTRQLGDALPPGKDGKLTVFRGVAGANKERWPKGWSWTTDLTTACWFAMRYDLEDPAIYSARVSTQSILCYLHEKARHEFEVVVQPSRVYRRKLTPKQIADESTKRRPWVSS